MHLPSFFVGSIVSGTGFLLIHRELSHRERLSKKWVLREKVEEEAMKIWQEARKSIPGNINNEPTAGDQVRKNAINKWNEGIDSIRKFVGQ